MKKIFLVTLVLYATLSLGQTQSTGWKELETGNYKLTKRYNTVDNFRQRRLWRDTKDNIYMVNYPIKSKDVDILKINETSLTVLKSENKELHYLCSDGSGGLYITIDKYYYISRNDDYVASYLFYSHNHNSSTLMDPVQKEYINGLCADGKGNVYVCYSYYNKESGWLKVWDGKNWKKLDFHWYHWRNDNRLVRLRKDLIQSVQMCADSSGNLYASIWGGYTASNKEYHCITKYDGKSWTELGTPKDHFRPNGRIYSMASDKNGNIYATGKFTDAGKYYVAKWDGTSWSKLGNLNANDAIRSIALDKDGNVYAAGEFTNPNHKHYVAKWDGNSWIELGSKTVALNANKPINSIYVNSNYTVFATGEFTNKDKNRYIAIYKQN